MGVVGTHFLAVVSRQHTVYTHIHRAMFQLDLLGSAAGNGRQREGGGHRQTEREREMGEYSLQVAGLGHIAIV